MALRLVRPSSRTLERKKLEKECDKLCRYLIVELRDKNTCQRCGKKKEDGWKIDWSHVITRRTKSLRWHEFGSKALCGGCHLWWGMKPEESRVWFAEKFPERWAFLNLVRQTNTKAPDLILTKKYLQAEIERAKLVGFREPYYGSKTRR
jgi:hypothetical protein